MAIKQLNDLSVDGDLTVTGGGTFQTPVTIDSDGSTDNYYLNFSENGASRFTIYENSNNIYFNGWAGHTIFRPRMAGSGSFAVTQGNTQFDTSGNATFAGNLTVTGGTITLGGTSFTKESVFITRTPTVGTTSDWDDFIQQGTYGVASSGGAQFTGDNRPVATKNGVTFEPDYRYGHLVVTEDSSGQGIQQTYYPHSGNQRVFTRTGWSDSSWGNWTMNLNTANMGSGSNLDADTLDGEHASAFVLGSDVDAGQVAFGDGTGLNGDSHFIWDSTNNRLGIGTTSPAADLHIEDAGNSTSGLRFSAVGTGNQDNVNFHFQGTAGSAPFYISRANTGGAEIQLQRDGDVILNGTNGDNCGIGTNSPSQKLDVNGNVRFRSRLYASNNSAGSSGQVLSSTGSGTQWVNQSSGLGGSGTSGYVARFTGGTTLGNSIIRDNGTNVGIGTSPDSSNKLVVNGSMRVVDNIYLNTGTSNSIVGTGGGVEFYTDSVNRLDITYTGDTQVHGNLEVDDVLKVHDQIDLYQDGNQSTVHGSIKIDSYGSYSHVTNFTNDVAFSFNNRIFQTATMQSSYQADLTGGTNSKEVANFYMTDFSGQGNDYACLALKQASAPNSGGNRTSNTAIKFESNNNTIKGTITFGGSGTQYNTTSDYRLKEDFKDFDGLNLVSQMKVYDFKWIDGERDYGVQAHELQDIKEDWATGYKDQVGLIKSEIEEDGDVEGIIPQQVDYSTLVPVLIKAIQELEAKVKILENK